MVHEDALEQWARLAPFMPGGCKGKRGAYEQSTFHGCAVVDGALGWTLAGLPRVYGDYRTVKRRYYDWVERDVLGAIVKP